MFRGGAGLTRSAFNKGAVKTYYMKMNAISLLLTVLLIYVVWGLFLFATQRSLIYYPVPEIQHTGARELRLRSDDVTLKILELGGSGPNAIIYFGGNAENVGYNIPLFTAVFPEYTVYLVNYRGYGGSTGSPTESGLYTDAVALFDHIKAKHPAISAIGRSLGGSVAVHLASVRDIDKLVLVTPFDSLVSVGRKHMPIFPVSLLLKDKYDISIPASGISSPTLVVIAKLDEIVPRKSTEALVSALPHSVVEVKIIPDAGHNFSAMSPDYLQALREFL
jgi:pimeloyl-ACP methyl ester carboxylesterase